MTTAAQEKYTMRHPLAIRRGADKGLLPHDLDEEDFLIWKIEQAMTDEDYDANLVAVDGFMEKVERYGKPVKTKELTDDQKGWAKADHYLHYTGPLEHLAKWFIDPDKPAKPIPAVFRLKRSRDFRERCDCTSAKNKRWRNNNYAEWGERHDGLLLVQCEKCGEVLVVPADKEES